MNKEEVEAENSSEIEAKQNYEREIQNRRVFPFIKINDFFEYGIDGDCVTFHLPGDFHDMFENLGKVKASAIIAKELIDAVTRINNQRNMGDSKLKKCSCIYMISPIFYAPSFYPKELRYETIRDTIKIETPIFKFFNIMGIKTATYTRQELQNNDFVKNNKEAQTAVKHFGTNKDVGAAILTFEELNSKEFQIKLKIANKSLQMISRKNKEER